MARAIPGWALVFSFWLALFSWGCGGGAVSTPAPPVVPVSITLSPSQATVPAGGQKSFFASVTGSTDNTVVWSVNGTAGGSAATGTISASGVYTAPTLLPDPDSVTIRAVANADTTKSASAAVTIALAMSPSSASLLVRDPSCSNPPPSQQQFAVVGTNRSIDWLLAGNPAASADASFGRLTSDGLYTAPSAIPPTPSFAVTGQLQSDSTQSASARVLISAGSVDTNRTGQRAPIELGTSGGNLFDQTSSACCSGTLGALLTRGGKNYILSNNHVLARSDKGTVGDAISQPGLVDTQCGGGATVANLSQMVTLEGNPQNTAPADAAIAEVRAGMVDTTGAILGLGDVNCGLAQPAPPASTTVAPQVGMPVAKVGRTTGLTCGEIALIAVDDVEVDYSDSCSRNASTFTVRFDNQVVIENPSFSNSGDSGSLIVNSQTAQPVGLLFAGDDESTVANAIDDVLQALPDPDDPNHPTPTFVGGSQHPVVACTGPTSPAVQANALQTSRPFQEEVTRAQTAKRSYLSTLRSDPAVIGVGIGRTPGQADKAAIVVLVRRGKAHQPIPSSLDGIPTVVKEAGPFRAFTTRGCPSSREIEQKPTRLN